MSDMEQSDVAPESAESVAEPATFEQTVVRPVFAVPTQAQQPSSAGITQAPEAKPEVREPVSIEDAARAVVIFVKAHRTAGDADLGAALADLEAALPEVPEPVEEAESPAQSDKQA